jgi:hypothetical protein
MVVVEPDKIDKNIQGLKYLCHPGTVKKMLMNLQKLEYFDPMFYKQFYKIYILLWDRYYKLQQNFSDPNEFIIMQLLTYLNSGDCVSSYATMNFTRYGYTSIYMDSINFEKNLKKAGCQKILVPFIINFMEGSHANLLIFDKDTKQVLRIEPNYGFESYSGLYNTSIDNRLEHFSQELGYTYAGFLPSSCQKMYHPGFCAFISAARYVYGLELTPGVLKEIIIDFLKREYNRICNKNLMN